jgi:hypothetical protein
MRDQGYERTPNFPGYTSARRHEPTHGGIAGFSVRKFYAKKKSRYRLFFRLA